MPIVLADVEKPEDFPCVFLSSGGKRGLEFLARQSAVAVGVKIVGTSRPGLTGSVAAGALSDSFAAVVNVAIVDLIGSVT